MLGFALGCPRQNYCNQRSAAGDRLVKVALLTMLWPWSSVLDNRQPGTKTECLAVQDTGAGLPPVIGYVSQARVLCLHARLSCDRHWCLMLSRRADSWSFLTWYVDKWEAAWLSAINPGCGCLGSLLSYPLRSAVSDVCEPREISARLCLSLETSEAQGQFSGGLLKRSGKRMCVKIEAETSPRLQVAGTLDLPVLKKGLM